MAKSLVIVESPAKAKTIEKYLGSDYTVRASVGHVRDLPKSNKDAVDVEGGFVPKYRIIPEKKKVIDELAQKAGSAKEVILATDPDREGEAIAYHVAEVLKLKKPKRIVFSEITQRAVQEALAHPRTIDDNLVQAQEARRVLDRLFGYDLSGLIWKKVRYGLSAGRVQSPALRIVMEREREIRAFTSHTYYTLGVTLKPVSGVSFDAICSEEPTDQKEAQRIYTLAQQKEWTVLSVDEREQKRSPRPPFTTSTLQQVASTRLGFAPSRTMRAAQKLYEAGAISYMRTDSTNLSKEALGNILGVVEKEYGKDYVQPRTYKTKSKNAQEAHEAIRPTDSRKSTAGKTDDERKLYALIRTRALASQMADAVLKRTKVQSAPAKTTDIPPFVANGSRILFEGWLKEDTAARGEETELPLLQNDDALTAKNAAVTEKHTEPPSRYTEAGLIKELEKRGIGRPSTYAATMKTLSDRGYVEKEGRTLIPTVVGDVVSSFIEEHFAQYISDTFTAEMETELDEIANGERTYKKTLADFYTPFTKDIKKKNDIPKLTTLGDAPKEYTCPECGGAMIYKLSKGGRFMSCARFPDCHGARKEDGSIVEPPKNLGKPCPKCNPDNNEDGGMLAEREGRFGKFVACDRYPKCKYIDKDATVNSTGVACPVCVKEGRTNGEMAERRGRFGLFYSCTNYPDCKYAIKAKPTGNTCAMCGSLMMEGTKTIPERCSDKSCPNHNPHKLPRA